MTVNFKVGDLNVTSGGTQSAIEVTEVVVGEGPTSYRLPTENGTVGQVLTASLNGESVWRTISSAAEFYTSYSDLPVNPSLDTLYVVTDEDLIYRAVEELGPSNTLGSTSWRVDYSPAPGSSDNVVGYKTAVFNLPSVNINQESTSPIYPQPPITPSPSSFDFTVGPTGDFATLADAIASPSVVEGSTIQVQEGTYTLSTTLTISKGVRIYGVNKSSVIFNSAGTSSDPVTLISVTANNVVLSGITVDHKKTSNTSVETAVSVSGGGFPQTRVSNFIMDDCIVRHIEFGLVLRGSDWKVSNTSFVYAGPNNSTRRHVGIYGFSGNCFAINNTSNESTAPGVTGNTRWFNLTSSTGTNPNETNVGTLVIDGNTQAGGNLQQFFNQDNWQGSAGQYNLVVKNNTTLNESSAFIAFFGGSSNFGDILGEVTVDANTLSNLGGKGIIALDSSALVNFRSSTLTVHAPFGPTNLSYTPVPGSVTQVAAPSSSSSGGSQGQISSDATYFYMYTGGRWQRVAWDATVW